MSPIDPRELGHGLTPKGTFEAGYRCVKCDYDLTGLPHGTICPECGTANARVSYDKKRGTGVSRAPIAYVNSLGTWLWVAACSFLGYAFFSMLAGIFKHPVILGLEFVAIAGWVGALWLVTQPKPDRYESRTIDAFDDHRWRWATVGSQACHLFTSILYALTLVPKLSAAASVINVGIYFFDTIAFLGFVPVCVQLAALSHWMGDDDAEKRCQNAAWLLAVGGVGLLVTPAVITVFKIFGLLYVVFVIFALIGVVLLAMSLFALARAANWAVQNTRHKTVVSGRRAVLERQRAIAAEAKLQERLDVMNDKGQPARAGRTAIPKDIPMPKSHTIDRPEDADPYEVKDE
ncbi:MAG: hypothetical protein ACIAS6_03365 [Phycisphaerales bacterium JB060]